MAMEEMRTFCLTAGCEIAFVRQQKRGHHISVLCTRWDYQVDRFLPPRSWSIHVSDNMEVVAADTVASYETGELKPYVVLANSSALALGLLQISQDKFTIVGRLAYRYFPAKLECLLTNGPTTVASLPGKILVMYPHYVGDSKHYDSHKLGSGYQTVEPPWVAYVLILDQIHAGPDVRLLFAHDGNIACTPEVVLGICTVPMDVMSSQQANHNLKSLQVTWQYIRLDLYSLGCYMLNIAQKSDYSVNQAWNQIYQKSASVLCNELFPADLNPLTISCIKLVPADPLTLASTVAGLETTQPESFPDVIIATYDFKILKCRHGKIIADAYLQNVPVSLNFAVVSGGQGVLLATLAGTEQIVIALCCETLQQLEVWSNVANVVAGDFQLVGHDQVLLVKSPTAYKPGPFPLEDLVCSMVITDFKRSGFIGLNDPQQELKFADKFEAVDHKSRHIQAVVRFLETRIEAGKLQEHQLQLKMEKKKQLLQSSCELMEAITSRHNSVFVEETSFLTSKSSSTIKESGLHLMEIEQVYHALRGRTWFIVIGARSRIPRGLTLDGATLLLVTVKGQIAGSTSSIRRVDTRDKLYKFVVAVPLQSFMAFPCFPVVNIMLKGWLSSEAIVQCQSSKSPTKEHGKAVSCRCLYTEWLGRICIEGNDLIRQFVPQKISHVIQAGESQVLMFRPKEEKDPFALPCEIKSVLHMDYSRQECSNLQAKESRVCELVTQSPSPFGQAYIYIFKDVALLTLYAEDSDHLSCMAALLISRFGHQYDVFQYTTCENMLGSILAFIGAFFRELEVKSSTWEAKDGEVGQGQSVKNYHKDFELLTDEACLHLIPTNRV